MEKVNLHKQLLINKEQIPDIVTSMGMLSFESESGLISKLGSYIAKQLTTLSGLLKGSISIDEYDIKDLSEQAKDVIKHHNMVKSIIVKKPDYSSIATLQVPVTLGYKGDIYTAVTDMKPVIEKLTELNYKVIDTVDTFISKVVTDSSFARKVTRVNITNSLGTQNKVYDIDKYISTIIDKNGVRDVATIEEVLNNIQSLDMIGVTLIELNKKFTYIDIKNIKQYSDKLAAKIDMFIEAIDNGSILLSKSTVADIAYEARNTAELITNTVAIFYVLNQLNSMYVHIVEAIKKNV